MRIPNLTISDAVVSRLNVLRGKQNEINQQLATGQRVTLASEDPAAVSRIMTLRSEVAVTQQYSRNVDLATGISQATGSALTSLVEISSRAGELAALTSGGTASAAERTSYAVELNQLISQAIEAGNSRFNGQYLFNGINSENAPFAADVSGVGDSVDHPTGVDLTNLSATDGTTIQLSDSLAVSPYSRAVNNAKIGTFVTNLVVLRNAMEANDTTAIATARRGLATSEGDVINSLAENSAGRGRLESIKTWADQRFTDLNGLIGRETDVDIAQSMVDLTKTQTAYQAALQAGAQILKLSLLDYVR